MDKLAFSTGLALSLGSQKLFSLAGSHLIIFNLLAAQALDLLEKLRHFVGHDCGGWWDLASCWVKQRDGGIGLIRAVYTRPDDMTLYVGWMKGEQLG